MTTATRTRRGYSRDNVQTHAQGYYGSHLPAVNVKVRGCSPGLRDVALPLDLGQVSEDGGVTWATVTTPETFSHEWIEAQSEHALNAVFEWACEAGWEQAAGLAGEIFGPGVETWAEGRSGGWLVVSGLPELEEWDAVALARWRKFERLCREIVADIPRAMAELLWANFHAPEIEAETAPVQGLA